MAVSSLMVLGTKALTANYAALQTTGHNIANANVPGYSRQRAELATATGHYTGSGFFGMGVDVQTVSRMHNQFLTREAQATGSLAAMDAARLSQLRRLDTVFKTGEAGLGFAATRLLGGFAELANRPGDVALRQVVLGRAAEMAARFDEAGRALDTLQADAWGELQAGVNQVNGLARSIAALNQQLFNLGVTGQPPNDLLDQRDRLIAQLGELVEVSRIDSADGSTSLFIGGGQRLVLGVHATEITLRPDAADPTRATLGLREGGVERDLGIQMPGGGRLAGLLRFQNEDLVDARNMLGRLGASVALAVNEQQARGISLRSLPGETPPPLFQLGPTQAIAHRNNARDGNGTPLAQVQISLSTPSALKPSDYLLEEDPQAAGQWRITRLVAGQPSRDPADRISFASGPVEFQGMTVDFGSPPPQPGDRFTLQPVARAAHGMRALLDDPRDIAAAGPLVAVTAAANTGSAAVAELRFDGPTPAVPGATVRIVFTDDNGGYDWQLLDAGGSPLGPAGSGTWQPGRPLPDLGADPPQADINGFSLQLSGVPRAGDEISLMPTPPEALGANNGNALLLAALRDAALAEGRSLTDTYALTLAEVGMRVQGARIASDISTEVARQAEAARSGVAGVNLDEEAARLIQFQQSYQAAAKVLQVAQTIMDTLLEATGR